MCLALCNLGKFNPCERHNEGNLRDHEFASGHRSSGKNHLTPQSARVTQPAHSLFRIPVTPVATSPRSQRCLAASDKSGRAPPRRRCAHSPLSRRAPPPPLTLWTQRTSGAGGSRWRRPGGRLAPCDEGRRQQYSFPCKPARATGTSPLCRRQGLRWGIRWAELPRGCVVRYTLRLGSLCRPGGGNGRALW